MNNMINSLFYILVLISGFFTLAITILGTIKSKIKIYWYLVAFYTSFSIMLLSTFLKNFLGFTIDLNNQTLLIFAILDSFISILFMVSITLFFQNLFINKNKKQHKIIIVILYFVTFALYFYPGAYDLLPNGELQIGNVFLVSTALFNILFIYMILLALFGDKKDKPIRELVLIWTLILFGFVGLIETVISFISQIRLREIALDISAGEFVFSSLPYFFSGGVLIYYFGSFLLAKKDAGHIIENLVDTKFGLTPRELDLIPLLIRGLNNKEIAESLFISLATVKTHIHNIYGKTGVRSRYELFHLTKKG